MRTTFIYDAVLRCAPHFTGKGSTQYRFGGPLNSPHLSVPYDRSGTVPSDPTLNVPRSGGFHVDSHSDWRHAIDVAQGKPE